MVFSYIVGGLFGLGLLYIGGWQIMFGVTYLPDWTNFGDIFWIGDGIGIEFNNAAYGISFYGRFFYSELLSWILLVGAYIVTTLVKDIVQIGLVEGVFDKFFESETE
ncbi:MAG: hypothetical protein DRQ51_08665 [Gammaproteobacteria bacterium]|nr:MAG: hypothetical protein DRQ51_08665 [Gammaproteobacteria bacterium]